MKKSSFLTTKDIPALYRKHVREIHAFVCSRVRNEDDAMDIVQDLFCRFHEYVGKNELPDINARAYLFRMARNLIIDRFRSAKNRKDSAMTYDISDTKVPAENRILDRMLISSIQRFLEEETTPNEADTFRFRYFHGLSLEEIAGIIDTSTASVSRILAAVCRKLEQKFPDVL